MSECIERLPARPRCSQFLLPSEAGQALRNRECISDREFDRFLPPHLQRVSDRYWTPIAAAIQAAEWLDGAGIRSVVDVGSGAGKFCVVAALASRCAFIGIEQRRELVAVARRLSKLFRVEGRVSFVADTFGEARPPLADCYYFYNPFAEARSQRGAWLDDSVEHGETRSDRDLCAAEHWLTQAPVGTYVLTYNGLGSELPRGYHERRANLGLPCPLRLWRKER